ncbi:MAG: hypothetical protein JO212_12835 [Acetobacteraceae bacterium]|nr:hypothetical protein [Acetobacteraceae bacterium]
MPPRSNITGGVGRSCRSRPSAKAPKAAGWDKRVYRAEELARVFGASDNIGVILGPRSAGLVDIDLDCREALGWLICTCR